jgi:hypothetical protein
MEELMRRIVLLPTICFLLLGCDQFNARQSEAPAPDQLAQAKTTAVGRFQVVFSPHLRADTFLVDTETGRIWRQTSYPELQDNPTAWSEMDVFKNPGDVLTFYKLNTPQK